MSKRKGFTLIELLAVIVILAVIALIATPLVLNIMERAEKGAFRDGVYGIMDAAEFQVILDNSKYPITFVYPLDSDRIKFKGTKPTEGYIQIVKEGKIKLALGNGRWCATKNENDSQVTIKNGHCEKIDFNRPIISGYGDLNQEINVNDSYNLPNVTATDKNGNQLNVTATMKQGDKIVDSIDTGKEGIYTITYTTEADSEGNQSSVTVTVTVKKQLLAGDKIIENGIRDGGLELIDDTYYYRGESSKNWIQFDHKLWRIISVDKNSGILKLIQNEGFEYLWDKTGGSNGNNNWNRLADINTYLNTTFYNSISLENRHKIQNSIWNIGTITWNTSTNASTIKSNEKTQTWTGKVGLMNASDYIYASTDTGCMKKTLHNAECKNDNWLFDSFHYQWTMNAGSGDSSYVIVISSNQELYGVNYQGAVSYAYAATPSHMTRPAIHLSPDVKVISGEGTKDSPFIVQ